MPTTGTMIQTAAERGMPPPLPPRRRRAPVPSYDADDAVKVERKPLVALGSSPGSEEELLYVHPE